MAGKWQAAGAIYCLYHCRRKLKLTIVTRLRRSSKVLTRIRIERDQGRTRFHDRVRFVLFGFVSACNLSIPRWYRVLRLCHCRTAALVIATFNLKRLDPVIFFFLPLFSFLLFSFSFFPFLLSLRTRSFFQRNVPVIVAERNPRGGFMAVVSCTKYDYRRA